MDNRIAMLQYQSLRKNFDKYLVKPILGEEYYNMGLDVYTADELTCHELKREFDNLHSSNTILKVFLIISVAVNVLLVVANVL